MASILNSSKFLPSYSIRNILWGFQLAILGTYYSLKNPKLFKQSYYVEACRVSFLSISLSLAIRYPFTIIPILVVFIGLYILSFELFTLQCFVNYFQFTVFNFFKVVRVSGNLNKELNELFLVSLEYMDLVDHQKHPDDTFHQYHYKLEALSTRSSALLTKLQREQIIEGESTVFFKQHIITALLVMVVSCFPYLLLVGSIVPALIIFLGLRSRIGIVLSCVITAVLLTLPKEFSMMFLILYWGSRNMVHDLLLPYFSKVKFSKMDKDQWIKSREGLLLGFSMCYYTAIIKFPWVGLLIYGLAESSMAYMIRKISEPPPDQMQLVRWTVDQLVWKDNKTLDDGETRNDEKSASSTEEEDKVDEP